MKGKSKMSKARSVSARIKRKTLRKRSDDPFEGKGLIRENEFLFGKDFAINTDPGFGPLPEDKTQRDKEIAFRLMCLDGRTRCQAAMIAFLERKVRELSAQVQGGVAWLPPRPLEVCQTLRKEDIR